jgi:hypothetical protein
MRFFQEGFLESLFGGGSKKEQDFKMGQKVKVRRSGGKLEEDWCVASEGIEGDGKVCVIKNEGGKMIQKYVKAEELASWQK